MSDEEQISIEEDNFFQKGMPSPGKLAVPRKELCIKCHKDKSDAKALREGIWLHTTAAKGDCNKCHDPHQSNHQYLLLETPRQILNMYRRRELIVLTTPSYVLE